MLVYERSVNILEILFLRGNAFGVFNKFAAFHDEIWFFKEVFIEEEVMVIGCDFARYLLSFDPVGVIDEVLNRLLGFADFVSGGELA